MDRIYRIYRITLGWRDFAKSALICGQNTLLLLNAERREKAFSRRLTQMDADEEFWNGGGGRFVRGWTGVHPARQAAVKDVLDRIYGIYRIMHGGASSQNLR